jgi:predicted PolB exonuclease-like 3'-5' exonuclease
MERVQGSFQGASYTSRHYGPQAQCVSGTHSGEPAMLQYAQAFNDLCQYAGYHADTDEKKRGRFRRGFSTKLRDHLNTVRANNYNELVNMAISQEDCITARQAEKKRKTPVAGPSA